MPYALPAPRLALALRRCGNLPALGALALLGVPTLGGCALAFYATGHYGLMVLALCGAAYAAAVVGGVVAWCVAYALPVSGAALARLHRARAYAVWAAYPSLANLAALMRARRAYAFTRWPV